MPFVRATLINNCDHLVVAQLQLLPGPVPLELAASAHSTEVFHPAPATVSAIDHSGSRVQVLGAPIVELTFADDLGGQNDDIQEAFVYVGKSALPERIGAWIRNQAGAVRWEERNLT